MVQEAFPEFGKIGTNPVDLRSQDNMAPQDPSPITPHSLNGLATVEQDIARACKEARRERASVALIAVSKTFDADFGVIGKVSVRFE